MPAKFKRSGSFYVYILRCCDGTYYTGYTPDLLRRVERHNRGRGAKYTRSRRPVELVWSRKFRYFKPAFKAERDIKKLGRAQKQRLIAEYARGAVERKEESERKTMYAGGEKYMRLAIREARKNLKAMKGGPFGACIIRDGRVLAVARNTVLARDATCHAEVNAIRTASRRTGSHDLSGAVIYSTTEPCPMCFGAIHWARIGTVIYGTGIKDADAVGFNELRIGNARLKILGKSRVKIIAGFMREECRRLLEDWAALPDRKLY